jgi:hypothetical protein
MLIILAAGTLLSIAAVETYCRWGGSCKFFRSEFLSGSPCQNVEIFPGKEVSSNCSGRLRQFVDEKLVYDVSFSGRDGFRVTPAVGGKKSYQALFFGCSVTEGLGVNDGTLPAAFSREFSAYSSNFGIRGTGPQSSYLLLSEGKLPGISDLPKIGIYVYGSWQMQRVTGRAEVSCTWGGGLPRFRFSSGKEIIRDGTLAEDCPFPAFAIPYLANSAIFRFLTSALAFRTTDREFDLIAQLIAQVRNEFRRRYHSENFFVVIYPEKYLHQSRPLLSRLRQAGLHTFDYSQLYNGNLSEFSIPGDAHPNAMAHARVAKELAKDLREELVGLHTKP